VFSDLYHMFLVEYASYVMEIRVMAPARRRKGAKSLMRGLFEEVALKKRRRRMEEDRYKKPTAAPSRKCWSLGPWVNSIPSPLCTSLFLMTQ